MAIVRKALLVLAAFLVAGCAEEIGPRQEAVLFANYRTCAGAQAQAPADCDDPRGDRFLTADWQESTPEGWDCRMGSDPTASLGWWLLSRPPGDAPTGSLGLEGQALLGLAYSLPPGSEVEGVIQIVSHEDQPIYRWRGTGGAGFVTLGVVGAQDEVLVNGVVAYGMEFGAMPRSPQGTNHSVVEAVGAEVRGVTTNWGRHPLGGGFPELHATQHVQLDDGPRYLPVFESPVSWTNEDPRELPGSSHTATSTGHRAWTNVTEGGASIRIMQVLPLRFTGHVANLGEGVCGLCEPFFIPAVGCLNTLGPPRRRA